MGGFVYHLSPTTYRIAVGRQKGRKAFTLQTRPAIAEHRLSLTLNGNVRYPLTTPYRDGTTHAVLLRASCHPPCEPA